VLLEVLYGLFLVPLRQSGVADDVGEHYRGEPSGRLVHRDQAK
jgi:hypothetical protein